MLLLNVLLYPLYNCGTTFAEVYLQNAIGSAHARDIHSARLKKFVGHLHNLALNLESFMGIQIVRRFYTFVDWLRMVWKIVVLAAVLVQWAC